MGASKELRLLEDGLGGVENAVVELTEARRAFLALNQPEYAAVVEMAEADVRAARELLPPVVSLLAWRCGRCGQRYATQAALAGHRCAAAARMQRAA